MSKPELERIVLTLLLGLGFRSRNMGDVSTVSQCGGREWVPERDFPQESLIP